MHFGQLIGYERRMAGLTPARPKPGRFAPSPKIFGEGATDNAPAGRGEGGGEAGLARVTYFDAITLQGRSGPSPGPGGLWQFDRMWGGGLMRVAIAGYVLKVQDGAQIRALRRSMRFSGRMPLARRAGTKNRGHPGGHPRRKIGLSAGVNRRARPAELPGRWCANPSGHRRTDHRSRPGPCTRA